VIKVIERDPEKLKPIGFMKLSVLWLAISLVAILASVGFMVANVNDPEIGAPVKLGIDYAGGTLISGTTGVNVTSHEIKEIVEEYSSVEPVVQVIKLGESTRNIEIRTRIEVDPTATLPEQNTQRSDKIHDLKAEISEKFGGFTEKTQAYVGPTVGAELINKAAIALIIGSILMLIYIFIRFGNFIFALAAVIALLHDVIITLGGVALLKIEINSAFIAVILTIIGYSINDTIIIFDRIRENMKKYPALEFSKLADISLTQTLVRSVGTVLTVIFMLLALVFFGGSSIQDFVRSMLIGMVSGAYSSIFIATPLIRLFRPKDKIRVAATVTEAERIGDMGEEVKEEAPIPETEAAYDEPSLASVGDKQAPAEEEKRSEKAARDGADRRARKRVTKKKGKARRR